jgi:hypothetical protein
MQRYEGWEGVCRRTPGERKGHTGGNRKLAEWLYVLPPNLILRLTHGLLLSRCRQPMNSSTYKNKHCGWTSNADSIVSLSERDAQRVPPFAKETIRNRDMANRPTLSLPICRMTRTTLERLPAAISADHSDPPHFSGQWRTANHTRCSPAGQKNFVSRGHAIPYGAS